jgi:adenine-specific DNA methylase
MMLWLKSHDHCSNEAVFSDAHAIVSKILHLNPTYNNHRKQANYHE